MSGRVITFSKNVFLPLTHVCHNRCKYCSFREKCSPDCIMNRQEVLEVLAIGKKTGCKEALFTFGERPEQESGFKQEVEKLGHSSILDYCYELCEKSIETGLLPHTNAGILTPDEMRVLSKVNASMGLMLETTADVPAHLNSPGKKPEIRIEMLENAGKLKIPFTTGLLIGIGETQKDREYSLEVISEIHQRYGHIQEVIIQNFCPKKGTAMENSPGATTEEIKNAVILAREILPDEVAVQIPPNLADAKKIIECGVNDLGGVSPVTVDYVNPEHPWPQITELKKLAGENYLRERLCIYQRFIEKGWYSERLKPLILKLNRQIKTEEKCHHE